MQARKDDNNKVYPSLTALSVAQAYYLSCQYNHFPMNDARKLIRYLVSYAEHVYPLRSKWFAELYDVLPVGLGKSILTVCGGRNYAGHIAVRKEYIGQSVEDAISEGAGQVLVIGGGFDVLALTMHKKYENVHFFEIDRGPHQQIKQDALTALRAGKFPNNNLRNRAVGLQAYGEFNENMHYVDADMAEQGWVEKLKHAGFDPAKKTIAIAEGFTMYITPDAMQAWLTNMQILLDQRGSLILSLMHPPGDSVGEGISKKMLANTNESYRMTMPLESASKYMFDNGYSVVERLPFEQIHLLLGETTEQAKSNKLRESYYKLELKKPDAMLQSESDIPVANGFLRCQTMISF